MKSYTLESLTRFTDGIVYVALVGAMLVSLSNLAIAENAESNNTVAVKTQVHDVTKLPATSAGVITGTTLHQPQLFVPNIQQQLQLKIEAKMQQQLKPVKVNRVAAR